MNRRNFITQASIAVVALVAAPQALVSHGYVLHGDGEHDDTAALQAWLDGKNVYYDGKILGHSLSHGRFKVTKTLHVGRNGFRIANCFFDGGSIGY